MKGLNRNLFPRNLRLVMVFYELKCLPPPITLDVST